MYRTRCRDFALFYDGNREAVDTLAANYFQAQNNNQSKSVRALPLLAVPPVEPVGLLRLEVKREMSAYVWVGQDDRAEVMELDELLRRAENGTKAKHIFKVAQEMELRFQLVPRKGIEKAKRAAAASAAAESGRAAARKSRITDSSTTNASTQTVSLPEVTTSAQSAQSTPQRRPRARAAKATGEK
ncbi:MAG: hypothetical protein WKF84_30545 [Pyrinomonadaceae bacterium]